MAMFGVRKAGKRIHTVAVAKNGKGSESMDYQQELAENEKAFMTLLKSTRPDIHELVQTINETMVNPTILCRVARHIRELSDFTHWGSVEVLINDNVMVKVQSISTEKTSVPIIIKKSDIV